MAMAARIRRDLKPTQKTAKKHVDYVERLERLFKELAAESGQGDDMNTVHGRRMEARTDRAKREAGKAKLSPTAMKEGQSRGKVLTVLDKMRGGFGKSEQADKVKDKLQHYEKMKKKLKKQNDALQQIAEITEEHALVNDKRYATEIMNLQRELHHVNMMRFDGGESVAQLEAINRQIQDEITRLKGVAEQQAAEEKQVMEEAFIKQIEARSKELDDERQSGQNKTGEWVKRNKKLQDELNRKLARTEAKHITNRRLLEMNKALHVEYSAQEDDKVLLLQESKASKAHNQRLKDRIQQLEAQISAMHHAKKSPSDASRAEMEGLMLSSLQQAKEDPNDLEKLHKYEDALRRANQLLEAERRNVRGVRAAHLAALSQRTELEVYLKQSILQRNQEILAKRAKDPSADTVEPPKGMHCVFTADDRQRVIEDVLSKERVIQLLYGTANDDHGVEPTMDTTPELDMQQLWEKWKKWAETAQSPTSSPAKKSEA